MSLERVVMFHYIQLTLEPHRFEPHSATYDVDVLQ